MTQTGKIVLRVIVALLLIAAIVAVALFVFLPNRENYAMFDKHIEIINSDAYKAYEENINTQPGNPIYDYTQTIPTVDYDSVYIYNQMGLSVFGAYANDLYFAADKDKKAQEEILKDLNALEKALAKTQESIKLFRNLQNSDAPNKAEALVRELGYLVSDLRDQGNILNSLNAHVLSFVKANCLGGDEGTEYSQKYVTAYCVYMQSTTLKIAFDAIYTEGYTGSKVLDANLRSDSRKMLTTFTTYAGDGFTAQSNTNAAPLTTQFLESYGDVNLTSFLAAVNKKAYRDQATGAEAVALGVVMNYFGLN